MDSNELPPTPRYRLIWGDNGPAPFESGWSIFVKLVALNMELPSYVAEIVRQHSSEMEPQSTTRDIVYWDSRWIDFRRFSYALGVDQNRLKNGFLGQLGFRDGHNAVSVRHCPECIESQYHSVLFYLEVLTHCPWHGWELQECKVCATALRSGCKSAMLLRDLSLQSANNESVICGLSCGHLSISLKKTKIFRSPSPSLAALISDKTTSILAWWKSVLSAGGSAPLLSPMNTAIVYAGNYFSMQALLSGAESVAGKMPFKSLWPTTDIGWIRWNDKGDKHYKLRQSPQKEIIGVYKQVRRHIYKRFMKAHKNCLNEVLHFDSHDQRAFRENGVCLMALAFIIWRMSHENAWNMQEFLIRHSAKVTECGHFWGYAPEHTVSTRSVGNCYFSSFIGALDYICEARKSKILEIRKEYCGQSMIGNTSYVDDDFIHSHGETSQKTGRWSTGDQCVIFRNIDQLIHSAKQYCNCRDQRGDLEIIWERFDRYSKCSGLYWTHCTFVIWPEKPISIWPRRKSRLYI